MTGKDRNARETFEATLADNLTDRQLEVFKTACLDGYSEWPRTRTGEDAASLLGIAQSAFDDHVGQHGLFAPSSTARATGGRRSEGHRRSDSHAALHRSPSLFVG